MNCHLFIFFQHAICFMFNKDLLKEKKGNKEKNVKNKLRKKNSLHEMR